MEHGVEFEVLENDEEMEEEREGNRGGRKQVKVGTTRRNARERNRVRHINSCFELLRQHIPHEDQHQKKLSKVDTLKSAMIYIENLRQLLQNSSFSSHCAQKDNSRYPTAIKQETFSFWSTNEAEHEHRMQ